MRNRRLKGVEAIVEREQRVPAEGDDDRLLLGRKYSRLGFFRPCPQIGDRRSLLPFRDRLLIDPVSLGERPQALLTILYRSTDRLCRRGAAVKNLAHSASLHSTEKSAPSKSGIKHLVHSRSGSTNPRYDHG